MGCVEQEAYTVKCMLGQNRFRKNIFLNDSHFQNDSMRAPYDGQRALLSQHQFETYMI